MEDQIVIGITGGSGSGKTHFLKKIMDQLPNDSMTLFSMDNYYKPIENQQKDENGIENFDLPESLDREAFFHDLQKLKLGQSVTIEEYNFNHREIKPQMITFDPTPVIIVEGIFTFHYTEIQKLLDLKIFIDTPDYLMLKRRIIRDAEERGYDLSDVLYRFEHHVTPAYRKYIAPSKEEADIIIPNHRNFDKALEVIRTYIKQFIH